MKIKDIIPYIIIAILMFFLITDSHKTEEVVTIPAKENTFIVEKPQPVIEYDTIYKDSIIEKVIRIPNPVNQELLQKYITAKDSLERYSLFRNAVTQRRYKEYFTDENQTITVTSDVTGTLDRQELSYEIAEQQIKTINPSEGLYLGGGLHSSYRSLQIPEPEVNISLLKNKQMYSLGVGLDHIRIDYKHKIF